jgi:hypothetical protein
MPQQKPKPSNNAFLQYTGMAAQMAIIIGLFVYVGRKLDSNNGVIYTLIASLLGVTLAFYAMIKSLNKK